MTSPAAPNVKAGREQEDNNAQRVARKDEPSGNPRKHVSPACRPKVVESRPGDHPAIYRFLLSIFQRPSAADYQAQLEDPYYEPTDRLLIKRGPQIIAHLRLLRREMNFGPLLLPVTLVEDVATLPEFRGQGCASALLETADQRMVEDGAQLGLLRTNNPHFYARRGWMLCGRHCYSTAGARDILSHLSALRTTHVARLDPRCSDEVRSRLNIRLWRHVEQAALIRLYDENTKHVFGPLRRSEPYWRWLISRRAFDRIYVAIDGPQKLELDESLTPIVGYAAVRDGRIVELMTSAQCPEAANELLARACGDAIERDLHPVRIDAPPGHPLHQIFEAAGGKHAYHEAECGQVFMIKLFDPHAFLELLLDQLFKRARSARLAVPAELGLMIEEARHQLTLTRRRAALIPGKLGRSYLECNSSVFTRLLLGHLNVYDAVASGRLRASTRVAAETASILFPRLPLWLPPLDDLQA